MPAITILFALLDESIHIEYSCARTKSQSAEKARRLMGKDLPFAAFLPFIWIEKLEQRERILFDLTGHCSIVTCGGKLQATVCVGYIEGGIYRVKNPQALLADEEFPLPREILCTNCTSTLILPPQLLEAISSCAEEFVRGIKEARMASKASLN